MEIPHCWGGSLAHGEARGHRLLLRYVRRMIPHVVTKPTLTQRQQQHKRKTYTAQEKHMLAATRHGCCRVHG